MTAPAFTREVVVGMGVPGDWWELPLDHRTRHQAIAAAVDARVAEQPALARIRTDLVSMLRRTARDAADAGAVYCASLGVSTTDSSLGAGVVVTVTTAADGGDLGDIGATLVRDVLTDPAVHDGTVDVVELAVAGPAVRVAARRDTVLGPGRSARLLSVQYFLPVAPGVLVVASFSSPSLVYAWPLTELFDAMASTLAVALPGPDGEDLLADPADDLLDGPPLDAEV